ncbi:MAG: helix-turn-helix transcriptional regulator [Coleofasciculaceae cyanobacterium]
MAIKTPLITRQPEIGQLVRELRYLTKMTQEEFAHLLGVSYPTVSRWENGHAHPSPLAIHKIEQQLRQMGHSGVDLMARYLHK